MPIKKKKFVFIIAAALTAAIIATLACLLSISPVLVIYNEDTATTYARYKMSEGEEFSVSFIHSVNLTPVYDYYTVGDGELVCDKCEYSSFGAGMPTEWEEDWQVSYEDGVISILGLDIRQQKFTYHIGTVYDHVLNIKGEDVSLTELCGKNSHVTLKIKKSVSFR